MGNIKDNEHLSYNPSIEDKIITEIHYLESIHDNTIAIQKITDKETQIYNLEHDDV